MNKEKPISSLDIPIAFSIRKPELNTWKMSYFLMHFLRRNRLRISRWTRQFASDNQISPSHCCRSGYWVILPANMWCIHSVRKPDWFISIFGFQQIAERSCSRNGTCLVFVASGMHTDRHSWFGADGVPLLLSHSDPHSPDACNHLADHPGDSINYRRINKQLALHVALGDQQFGLRLLLRILSDRRLNWVGSIHQDLDGGHSRFTPINRCGACGNWLLDNASVVGFPS